MPTSLSFTLLEQGLVGDWTFYLLVLHDKVVMCTFTISYVQRPLIGQPIAQYCEPLMLIGQLCWPVVGYKLFSDTTMLQIKYCTRLYMEIYIPTFNVVNCLHLM